MDTICRPAHIDEAEAIVQISVRVQNVFTAAGSLQVIGPLDLASVQQAIKRLQCFVLARTSSVELGTELLGCTLFRPLEADHFLTTKDFQIQHYPSPWFFMGSVMLEPEHQRRGLGLTLVHRSVELLQQHEPTGTIFLDCWAGSDKLREYYAKAGFTFAAVVPQEDYEVAIFYWELNGSG